MDKWGKNHSILYIITVWWSWKNLKKKPTINEFYLFIFNSRNDFSYYKRIPEIKSTEQLKLNRDHFPKVKFGFLKAGNKDKVLKSFKRKVLFNVSSYNFLNFELCTKLVKFFKQIGGALPLDPQLGIVVIPGSRAIYCVVLITAKQTNNSKRCVVKPITCFEKKN